MKAKDQIKQHKIDEVSSLAEKMKSGKAVVFVDYGGMTMKGQQALKAALSESKANMVVSKNTYLKIAGQAANLDEKVLTDSVLGGQTALVWGTDDAVAPIQALGKFMSQNELPKWKGGIVDGSFQDAAALAKISKLPTKEVLYSQVVGSIMSPLYGVVGTLNGNLQKLVWMLKAKAEQG